MNTSFQLINGLCSSDDWLFIFFRFPMDWYWHLLRGSIIISFMMYPSGFQGENWQVGTLIPVEKVYLQEEETSEVADTVGRSGSFESSSRWRNERTPDASIDFGTIPRWLAVLRDVIEPWTPCSTVTWLPFGRRYRKLTIGFKYNFHVSFLDYAERNWQVGSYL